MKKIFIMAGEVSGDITAAWYVQQRRARGEQLALHGVGGTALLREGMQLFKPMSEFNVVGIIEIIRYIPRLLHQLSELAVHITQHEYDEIVLVDFPGFNLRLAKLLKSICPSLPISYVAPPQLWMWGAWRLKPLVRYTDRRIVLYQFEVGWYATRGVTVECWGHPLYKTLVIYHNQPIAHPPKLALIMASRASELATLGPILARAAYLFLQAHPEVLVVIPRADSIPEGSLRSILADAGLMNLGSRVELVSGQDRYAALASCALALSKPGTITLELAGCGVPTIIAYKTSWFTYKIAECLVSTRQMALPNLFLGKLVMPEYLQERCEPVLLAQALEGLYEQFQVQRPAYLEQKRLLTSCIQQLTPSPPHLTDCQ